ncbi:hypothetical protein K9B35_13160 [Sphingomonas sp. R647]|uniref:hypothetical protein n=1 Tax=Sphingomonas sp. R647 TaxID=2875233 RepID=UPI001CD33FE2|nr:hypothetical protein [Sphingomonas sp. R647]MCA1198919.1 hypothetical protein [Sphingomonas sp. R647]
MAYSLTLLLAESPDREFSIPPSYFVCSDRVSKGGFIIQIEGTHRDNRFRVKSFGGHPWPKFPIDLRNTISGDGSPSKDGEKVLLPFFLRKGPGSDIRFRATVDPAASTRAQVSVTEGDSSYAADCVSFPVPSRPK